MTEAILKAEKLKRVFTSGKSSFAAVDQVSFEQGKRPVSRRATVLFPLPDSPTMPRHSPFFSSKLT